MMLTTSEVAEALGVSESSIKRWIDSGDLPATRTGGGHRRIDVASVAAFVAARNLRIVNPALLGVSDDIDVTDFQPLFDGFTEALRVGNGAELTAILGALSLAGHSPARLCDELIFPSFKIVRSSCLHPSEECVVLHRAIATIVASLKSKAFQSENQTKNPPRGGILCADVGYDVDGLPTFLAEAALSPVVPAVQLGVNVPISVVKGVLLKQKPAVLWLSGSGPMKDRQLIPKVFALLDIAEQCKTRVCVFGSLRVLPRHKNATYLSSFSELFGFVRALCA